MWPLSCGFRRRAGAPRAARGAPGRRRPRRRPAARRAPGAPAAGAPRSWTGSSLHPSDPAATAKLLGGRLVLPGRPSGRGARVKLAIGAVVTFFAVALAGARAERIVRLVAAGKPAPDRFQGAWAR